MTHVLQTLITGILVGGVYALISVGLALIFGVMNVINFAQGDFMMLGMYLAYYLVSGWGIVTFLGPSVGPIVAALIAGPVLFAAAWPLHRFLVGRVSGDRAGGHEAQLLLTLGISLIIQNLALIFFGSIPLAVLSPLANSSWEVGEIFLNQARVVGFVIAVCATLLLTLFLNKTHTGKTLRAAADSPTAATYVGIDVDRSHRLAFQIGIGLTAMAGGLVALYYPLQPYVGVDFIVIMFVAVVLGGLGSISGAFWGGMIIGIVQQMSTLVLDVQLMNVVIFVIFLVILFVRPQGLFGRFMSGPGGTRVTRI